MNSIIIVYLFYIIIVKNKTSKKKMTQISKTFIFYLNYFSVDGTVIQIKFQMVKNLRSRSLKSSNRNLMGFTTMVANYWKWAFFLKTC